MSDEIPTIPTAPELPRQQPSIDIQQNKTINNEPLQESIIKPLSSLEEIQDIYSKPKEDVKQPEIKQTVKPVMESHDNDYSSNDKSQQFSSEWTKPTIETKPSPPEQQKPLQTVEVAKRPGLFLETLKAIGIFLGIFILIYLFLTFPAYMEKIKYFINNIGKDNKPQTIEIPNLEITSGDLFLSTLEEALENVPQKTKQETKSEPKHTIDISDLENNHLIIPKIDIKAPIIWNSPPDEEIMLNSLQKGVAHYNGTALPDQDNGNVFISGHSSYYWWDKGGYKTVFVNLDKLEIGDEIALAYNNKVFIYKVFEKIEVKPDQVEVLNQTDKPIVSLMTCVPIGTNLRRLIIKAERIDITSEEETKSETIEEVKPGESKDEVTKEKPKETPPLSPTIDKENLELLPWR